jgi:beta-lactamase class D
MLALPTSVPAQAASSTLSCTLIVDAATGEQFLQQGVCDQRVPPFSTFKLPLALIGAEAGIITGEYEPRWDYKPEYKAVRRDRHPVDPSSWLDESVVWYSREITRRLGEPKFSAAVANLHYGNGDVSGDPGKHNGLTQSWLGSSLQISPAEQVTFIRHFLARHLPFSSGAFDLTTTIAPIFQSGEWTVHGKTGSGSLRTASGESDTNRPLGWFVGWAELGKRQVVFARLDIGAAPAASMGRPLRADFLSRFPALMAGR